MPGITDLPPVKFHITADRDIFQIQREREDQKSTRARISRIAWNVFSVLVFPVGMARLAVKTVKWIAPHFILPAASTFNYKAKSAQFARTPTDALKKQIETIVALDNHRENFLKEPSNLAEQATIRTADEVNLDAVVIHHAKQKALPPQEQKWIVYLNGNGTCYESNLKDLKYFRDQIGVNVLTGNYRGVFRSEGQVQGSRDLQLDAEAMVQYLLTQGVLPNNILIHGWSLGGAVATETAALHQEAGKEMHLVSERSFASIHDFVGRILGTLAYYADWKFNGVAAFTKVRGNKFTIHTHYDGVIDYRISLYKKLKEATKGKPKPKAIKFSPHVPALTKAEIIKKHGFDAHCVSLAQLGEVTELYIAQAKEALQIAG